MALVIGLYLVPSVLFWTSGIYKEVIAILCVGFIIYLTDFGLAKSYSLKRIIALIGFVCLLFFLKIYILACLTPLLLINFIVSKTGERNYWIKYGICFVVFVFAFHLCSKISPQTNFYQLLADKQAKAISESEGGIFLEDAESFIRVSYKDSATLISAGPDLFFIKEGTPYLSWKLNNMKDTTYVIQNSGSLEPPVYKLVYRIKPANSAIRMSKMEPGFLGIVKRIPFAIATVFFQPTLFSIQNALALFSWLENMWLLLLITLMILFFNRTMIVKKEVFTFCLLFALFQFAMIGLTSPVVGAVVRYKVTALPFLFTICLLYADWDKILKKVSKNKD